MHLAEEEGLLCLKLPTCPYSGTTRMVRTISLRPIEIKSVFRGWGKHYGFRPIIRLLCAGGKTYSDTKIE